MELPFFLSRFLFEDAENTRLHVRIPSKCSFTADPEAIGHSCIKGFLWRLYM